MWLQEEEEVMQKEVKELCRAMEKLKTDKAQEELKMNTIEEITELNKETNWIFIENAHIFIVKCK